MLISPNYQSQLISQWREKMIIFSIFKTWVCTHGWKKESNICYDTYLHTRHKFKETDNIIFSYFVEIPELLTAQNLFTFYNQSNENI